MQMPGFIERDVPLSACCTLGVGGKADYLVDLRIGVGDIRSPRQLHVDEPLLQAYEFARDEGLDIFVVGGGSNLLVSDNGFHGLVIRLREGGSMEFCKDKIWISAGAMVSELVQLGKIAGFTGFEFLAGLPGTVGGAIYGNAGCYDSQFWDVVEEVRFFDGEYVRAVSKNSSMFGYRWSVFKDNPGRIILSAGFKAEPKGKKVVAGEIRRIHQKRVASQPKARSAGCIFKNLSVNGETMRAGALIDYAGLKGMRIGNAMISQEHGNFFVNLGGAKASDFIELIKIAKGRVYGKFGVSLEEEIIKVGEF